MNESTNYSKYECRICSNKLDVKLYSLKEMFLCTKEIYEFFQCENCRCIQIAEFPEDFSAFYPENYYSFKSNESEIVETENWRIKIKRSLIRKRDEAQLYGHGILGKILNLFKPLEERKLASLVGLGLKPNSRILDVGCGSGEFLMHLFDLGMKDLTGIDPFLDKDILKSNGPKIYKRTLEEISADGSLFDLVMLHHVFEHVKDPLNVLKHCKKLLEEQGFLLIRIPIADCYAWREYSVNWVQLDSPRHTFIYSMEAIRMLSSEAGLEIVDLKFDSTDFQFWGSIQYANDICLNAPNSYMVDQESSIFSRKEIKQFIRRADKLNEQSDGDQCVILLRKSIDSKNN